VVKKSSASSITNAWSLITIAAARSSVNCDSKVNPSAVKKPVARGRSATGRFTKILRYGVDPGPAAAVSAASLQKLSVMAGLLGRIRVGDRADRSAARNSLPDHR
jgi:hypothetical protein